MMMTFLFDNSFTGNFQIKKKSQLLTKSDLNSMSVRLNALEKCPK